MSKIIVKNVDDVRRQIILYRTPMGILYRAPKGLYRAPKGVLSRVVKGARKTWNSVSRIVRKYSHTILAIKNAANVFDIIIETLASALTLQALQQMKGVLEDIYTPTTIPAVFATATKAKQSLSAARGWILATNTLSQVKLTHGLFSRSYTGDVALNVAACAFYAGCFAAHVSNLSQEIFIASLLDQGNDYTYQDIDIAATEKMLTDAAKKLDVTLITMEEVILYINRY